MVFLKFNQALIDVKLSFGNSSGTGGEGFIVHVLLFVGLTAIASIESITAGSIECVLPMERRSFQTQYHIEDAEQLSVMVELRKGGTLLGEHWGKLNRLSGFGEHDMKVLGNGPHISIILQGKKAIVDDKRKLISGTNRNPEYNSFES